MPKDLSHINDPLKCLFVWRGAAGKPHTDVVCQYTFSGAAVDDDQQLLHVHFSEDYQKVEMLLGLL